MVKAKRRERWTCGHLSDLCLLRMPVKVRWRFIYLILRVLPQRIPSRNEYKYSIALHITIIQAGSSVCCFYRARPMPPPPPNGFNCNLWGSGFGILEQKGVKFGKQTQEIGWLLSAGFHRMLVFSVGFRRTEIWWGNWVDFLQCRKAIIFIHPIRRRWSLHFPLKTQLSATDLQERIKIIRL